MSQRKKQRKSRASSDEKDDEKEEMRRITTMERLLPLILEGGNRRRHREAQPLPIQERRAKPYTSGGTIFGIKVDRLRLSVIENASDVVDVEITDYGGDAPFTVFRFQLHDYVAQNEANQTWAKTMREIGLPELLISEVAHFIIHDSMTYHCVERVVDVSENITAE